MSERTDFIRATELTPAVREAIADAFEYHRWTPEMELAGNQVREALKHAIHIIIECVPPGPDRSAAIRKIREARMDCNSAITHEGRY